MRLHSENINYIREMALKREKRDLTEAEKAELYDSLDCLDISELTELYIIVKYGCSMDSISGFKEFEERSKEFGYQLVDILFEMEKLGSLLQEGNKKRIALSGE